MIAVLERFAATPFGVFGRLLVDERQFYTVERPWLNNEPGKSCVPLGEYDLVWQPTTTNVPNEYGGATWYLSGGTVSPDHGGAKRTRVAIHIGNTMKDVSGCIAVGGELTTLGGMWAIGRSRVSMVELLSKMPRHGARLKIIAAEMG